MRPSCMAAASILAALRACHGHGPELAQAFCCFSMHIQQVRRAAVCVCVSRKALLSASARKFLFTFLTLFSRQAVPLTEEAAT